MVLSIKTEYEIPNIYVVFKLWHEDGAARQEDSCRKAG